MTARTDEQERRDFDRFMSDGGKFPQAIERDANGNYVLMQAASSWHVWQARAALQSQDRDALREIANWPNGGKRYGQEKIKDFARRRIEGES